MPRLYGKVYTVFTNPLRINPTSAELPLGVRHVSVSQGTAAVLLRPVRSRRGEPGRVIESNRRRVSMGS